MASEAQKRELIQKVSELVKSRYAGDYQRAFQHYARKRSSDEKVNSEELRELLSDAGIGNGLTRGLWVDGIIQELDKDNDQKISWQEFQGAVGK